MAEFLIADLKCPTCGREFEDKAVFRAHMEFHARKKPFKCPECNYSSESQHRLDQHMHKVEYNNPVREGNKVKASDNDCEKLLRCDKNPFFH